MNKQIKNLTIALFVLSAMVTMSSCGRGGYGCPYELKAPVSLFSFGK
ncbi:MAG: hypothetical protein IPN29_00120 [Saprospiraceae bacterium]|nr:hypothetical protein [Saprospiraceae bacterium]